MKPPTARERHTAVSDAVMRLLRDDPGAFPSLYTYSLSQKLGGLGPEPYAYAMAQRLVRNLSRAGWRLDREQVAAPVPPDEKTLLIRSIRSRLPIVAIGHPELAAEIGRAMDMVEASATGFEGRLESQTRLRTSKSAGDNSQ